MENSGNFTEARKQLFQTAIKASFKLCRDMKSATPSIKTFLHLLKSSKFSQYSYIYALF
jgi:hypothetical protein